MLGWCRRDRPFYLGAVYGCSHKTSRGCAAKAASSFTPRARATGEGSLETSREGGKEAGIARRRKASKSRRTGRRSGHQARGSGSGTRQGGLGGATFPEKYKKPNKETTNAD